MIGTRKRDRTFPFVYDNSNVSRRQVHVDSVGVRSSYWATRNVDTNSSNRRQVVSALAYRNGTGRVALLQTSKPSLAAHMWEFVFHDGVTKETQVPASSASYSSTTDPFLGMERMIRILTETQRTPDWFLMRSFRITSSVSSSILVAIGKAFQAKIRNAVDPIVEHPDDRMKLVFDRLGIRWDPAVRETIDGLEDAMLERDPDVLKLWTNAQLSDQLRLMGLPVSGNKTLLVDRIVQHFDPGVGGDALASESNIRTRMMESWFMRPMFNSNMKVGTANEPFVIKALPSFVKDSSLGFEVVGLREYGLLCCKDKPHIATSPDGVIAMKNLEDGVVLLAAVEIKTRTTRITQVG